MMVEEGSLRKVVQQFTPENDQELALEVGDIILVVKRFDKHWCVGISNEKEGHFPTNYTTDIPIPTLEENQELFVPHTKFIAQENGDLSFNKGDLIVGVQAVDSNWWVGKCNGNQGIFPLNYVWKIDRSRLLKKSSPRRVFKKARVKVDMKAQLDTEIDLVKDEIITVTEEIDKVYWRGECNGKSGIFPSSCVTVISAEDGAAESIPDSSLNNPPLEPDRSSPAMPFVDAAPVHPSNQHGYDCVTSGITAYGQVIFPFVGEYPTDLSLREGELVNLICHVDEKWMQGEIDGRVGIFPKEFINIIVDCPASEVTDAQSSAFPCDTHGRVLEDFYPENQIGVKLSKNETVTMIRQEGEDLYVVEKDNGLECVCPIHIIELIGSDALPPSYEDVVQADSRSKYSSQSDVLNSLTRSDRPLSYPSATFCKASSSPNQSNFSFNSVPNIDDKIGENLSSLDTLFSSSTANETRTSSHSMSFNEPISSFRVPKLERPSFQPGTYENIRTSQSNCSTPGSNDVPVSTEAGRNEAASSNKSADAEKRRAEERKKKMQEQRNCIITEILQTERDYKSDLEIMHNIFVKNSQEAKAARIDIEVIFGNLDEVIDLSKQLIRRLDKVSKDSYENQMIGRCFIDVAEEMTEVYGHYCRNHDEVNAVLDKYEERPAASQYLKHKVELMKRQTNCFDLPSMLIKPVQRILKYPLLLNELIKCTEDGHVDKQSLIEAIALMTNAATTINEFKRRKDLVSKYRKHAYTSFSERISKLNMHSVLKKSSRFGMRLSNTIGLTHVTKDEHFLKLECQFRTLEKSVKIFIKDVNTYIEKTEELVQTAFRMAEDISELYGEKKTQQEIDVFRSVHRIISTQYWESNKKVLERNVLDILKKLLQAFEGPNNLIQKRADKLLDYDACTNKLEKNRDGTKVKMLQDNLHVAKNTYEALNSQLKDDLPRLYSISVEILLNCVFCFLKAKKNFVGRSAKEMLNLAELPLLLGSHDDILDTFQVKHTLVTDNLCAMNIVPKQFFSSSNTSTLKRNSSPAASFRSLQNKAQAQQSSVDVQLLKSSYPAGKLYTANQDYNAADIFDLSLSKGDLVGVVKEQDPMGNKLRWFVDKGGSKGFVSSKILRRYIPSAQLNAWNTPQNQVGKKPSSYYSTVTKKAQEVQPPDLMSDWKDTSPVQPQQLQAIPSPTQHPLNGLGTGLPTALSFDLLAASEKVSGSTSPSSQLNSSDGSQHKYEEIDSILGLYDSASPDSSTRNQSMSSSSVVSLDEFDPYGPLREHAQLYDNVPACQEAADSSAGHRYEEIPDNSAEVQAVPDVAQYYFAMYDFSPTGANQLKMLKGQVVRVVKQCDLSQNSEWWLVEDRYGNQGYVPANYLKKYPQIS